MDLEKGIRQAIRTGKVEIGMETTMKAAMTGRARLVVISNKCDPVKLDDLRRFCSFSGIPVVEYDGNGNDLGRVCRKPFQVSSLAVVDPGDSNVLAAAKGA